MEITATIKGGSVRRHFDEKSGKWYFSVVDVLAIATKSSDARNYWKVLKNRLKKGQNKLVTECNQLKMPASDGKLYLTDVADEETMLQILKLVAEEYVLPFRLWFDNLERRNGDNFNNLHRTSYFEKIGKESYPQQYESREEKEELQLMIDGYREGDFFIVKAFVAGVDIENILISVTCKTITIKGERKILKNIYEENYNEQELYWGKFSRVITLPEEVEINQTLAQENHGLLIIKLPVINKNRSKLLKVGTM